MRGVVAAREARATAIDGYMLRAHSYVAPVRVMLLAATPRYAAHAIRVCANVL